MHFKYCLLGFPHTSYKRKLYENVWGLLGNCDTSQHRSHTVSTTITPLYFRVRFYYGGSICSLWIAPWVQNIMRNAFIAILNIFLGLSNHAMEPKWSVLPRNRGKFRWFHFMSSLFQYTALYYKISLSWCRKKSWTKVVHREGIDKWKAWHGLRRSNTHHGDKDCTRNFSGTVSL